jgi:hypothetical protein
MSVVKLIGIVWADGSIAIKDKLWMVFALLDAAAVPMQKDGESNRFHRFCQFIAIKMKKVSMEHKHIAVLRRVNKKSLFPKNPVK